MYYTTIRDCIQMVGRSIDLFVFGEMWETIYQISDDLEIDLCTWGFTSMDLGIIWVGFLCLKCSKMLYRWGGLNLEKFLVASKRLRKFSMFYVLLIFGWKKTQINLQIANKGCRVKKCQMFLTKAGNQL